MMTDDITRIAVMTMESTVRIPGMTTVNIIPGGSVTTAGVIGVTIPDGGTTIAMTGIAGIIAMIATIGRTEIAVTTGTTADTVTVATIAAETDASTADDHSVCRRGRSGNAGKRFY